MRRALRMDPPTVRLRRASSVRFAVKHARQASSFPRPRVLRVRTFESPRNNFEGAGAPPGATGLPAARRRQTPCGAPARRLFAGGPCFRGREPCKPNRSRRLGHRGNLPWEQIKAPMRADFLRPAQSRVQPGEAAGLSCPRTVTSSVPVFRLRGETASAEPFPAQMTPHEHAPRRERVIGI